MTYAESVLNRPSVVVVVATYQRPAHVEECLSHLARQTKTPGRIVVVDASPGKETHDVVAAHRGVEYRRNELGIGHTATSRAIGVADAGEDIVAFLDDDAYAEPDWLERLLEPYRRDDIGAVGGRALNGQAGEADEGLGEIGLLMPDGRLTGFFAADPGRDVDVDHMLGANMSVRMAAVREVGGIRDFYPGTCLREETDIALRLRRAGWRIVYTPNAVVRHIAGDYAKGRRFDARYRYYGARNHVVLLATTLGWRDPHVRRYARTASMRALHEVALGLRALRDRQRVGVRAKARGFAGGLQRSGIDVAGTIVGAFAAVRANRSIRRSPSGGLE
jgi:GT2 family glycosyltransferase